GGSSGNGGSTSAGGNGSGGTNTGGGRAGGSSAGGAAGSSSDLYIVRDDGSCVCPAGGAGPRSSNSAGWGRALGLASVLGLRRRGARAGLVLLAFALLAMPRVAQAETSRAAQAEALIKEGNRLMGKKAYAEACAKYAESQRYVAKPETLLKLGAC